MKSRSYAVTPKSKKNDHESQNVRNRETIPGLLSRRVDPRHSDDGEFVNRFNADGGTIKG